MEVLITGGAGFIGSNFVHYALKARPDWTLTVVDALTYAGNMESIAEPVEAGQIEYARVDIADASAVAETFQGKSFDLVINFAAETHVDRSIHSASEFVRTNVMGTQILLDAVREQGRGRFVQISTDEVYGALGPTGRFTETTPLDPTSPYSASKAGADLVVHAFVKTHGVDAVVTRCTNNYGPYQFPEKFIPLFVTNAMEDKQLPLYGDGMHVRSWIHVDDHCEAVLQVAERGRTGEVYNVGGDEEAELPNRHVANLILQTLRKPESLLSFVEDRLAHDRRYAVDCSKIRSELGWQPHISFERGIVDTIEWYKSHRAWWDRIKSGEYKEYYQQHYGMSA